MEQHIPAWLIVRFGVSHRSEDFQDDCLSLADHKRIDEGVHRLRVETGMSSGNYQRVRLATLYGPQRDTGQVKHVEGIGIQRFIRQGKTQDIKIGQGVFCLQRIEWDGICAHLFFHIHPGSIRPFGQRVRALVDQVIQDLQTQVRDADIIDVGKNKGDFGSDPVPVFNHAV